ncbi:MAG: 3-hydroxyacyl-CoA dehydrogenase NAD-binding domain-containing protein [Actinomycetales bacterium]
MSEHATPETVSPEVVFRLRDVDLPAVSGRPSPGVMALLTMDNGGDHKKPTVLGLDTMASLGRALDSVQSRAAAGEIVAVGVIGKPYFFAAGADLKAVGQIATREDALTVARAGHAQLSRLSRLSVPSFAFVNGLALGGGLEVALNCTYRTISTNATVGLPETMLGLVPGWGGAYLLPHLVGPQQAIQVMVWNPLQQNKMLNGADAVSMGIGDVLLEPADFLVESLRWAGRVLTDPDLVSRTDHTDDPAWAPAVAAARAALAARVGEGAPAPYRALDLIEAARTSDPDTGFAAEDEALADLVMSEQFRAGLYAFNLVQRVAKRPPAGVNLKAARPVTMVGVVGAGLMASQLALLFARRLDVPAVMSDLDQDRVAKGLGYVRTEIDKLAAKGRISPDQATRLAGLVTGSVGNAGFAEADLVIEAVFEELSVKKQVFADVEKYVSAECVLATNTSSLSVTEMAADLTHPERVVGMHFFNPVAVMPLLEIVHTAKTDEATLATAFKVAKGLRKTTIGVADAPSFVVNRLLGRFMGEVGALVDEGVSVPAADAAVVGLAPMAPFQLMGLVGPAIALHNNTSLHRAFPDRFVVPENLTAVVEAGKQAYYLPAKPGTAPVLDPEVVALLPTPAEPEPLSANQIRARVLDALADEARRMLDEGVVSEPHEIDLAMITGAGFTLFDGGLLPLLDREGSSERVTGRRFLPPGVASVPA